MARQLSLLQTPRSWKLSESTRAVGRQGVASVHRDFLPLNEVVARACTAVQIDPSPQNRDASWQLLSDVATDLAGLEDRLTGLLARFGGYHRRFATALFRADERPVWLTGTEVDSCHRVWFELHEDLIASLGLSR